MANDLGTIRLSTEYVSSLSRREKILLVYTLVLFIADDNNTGGVELTLPDGTILYLPIKGYQCGFNTGGLSSDEYRTISLRWLRAILKGINDVEFCQMTEEVANYVINHHRLGEDCNWVPQLAGDAEFCHFLQRVRLDDGEYQYAPWSRTTFPIMMELVRESAGGRTSKRGGKRDISAFTVEDHLKALEADMPKNEAVKRRIDGLWKERRAQLEKETQDGPDERSDESEGVR